VTAAFEERLRRVDDRIELLELPGRYHQAIDDRDIPALVALFTEDGRFVHTDGTGPIGRDEIEQFYLDILGGYGMSVHIPHAQVIERLAGDEASGWVLAHAELAVGDRYVVVALRYEDEYRRVEGRWRFASRTLWFWYFADSEELSETVVSPNRKRFRSDPRPGDLPELLPTYRDFVTRTSK
jgi:uncharacterized protein (TIGR02246 family)